MKTTPEMESALNELKEWYEIKTEVGTKHPEVKDPASPGAHSVPGIEYWTAAREMKATIIKCRELGCSWAKIAAVSGMNAMTCRNRYEKFIPQRVLEEKTEKEWEVIGQRVKELRRLGMSWQACAEIVKVDVGLLYRRFHDVVKWKDVADDERV